MNTCSPDREKRIVQKSTVSPETVKDLSVNDRILISMDHSQSLDDFIFVASETDTRYNDIPYSLLHAGCFRQLSVSEWRKSPSSNRVMLNNEYIGEKV